MDPPNRSPQPIFYIYFPLPPSVPYSCPRLFSDRLPDLSTIDPMRLRQISSCVHQGTMPPTATTNRSAYIQRTSQDEIPLNGAAELRTNILGQDSNRKITDPLARDVSATQHSTLKPPGRSPCPICSDECVLCHSHLRKHVQYLVEGSEIAHPIISAYLLTRRNWERERNPVCKKCSALCLTRKGKYNHIQQHYYNAPIDVCFPLFTQEQFDRLGLELAYQESERSDSVVLLEDEEVKVEPLEVTEIASSSPPPTLGSETREQPSPAFPQQSPYLAHNYFMMPSLSPIG